MLCFAGLSFYVEKQSSEVATIHHRVERETKAQRREVICPELRQRVKGEGTVFEPSLSNSRVLACNCYTHH